MNICYNFTLLRHFAWRGWIPEWPKGTDCKSAAICFGGSNPPPSICTLQWARAPECVTSILKACLQSACYAFRYRRIRRDEKTKFSNARFVCVRWCGGIGRRKGLKIPHVYSTQYRANPWFYWVSRKSKNFNLFIHRKYPSKYQGKPLRLMYIHTMLVWRNRQTQGT